MNGQTIALLGASFAIALGLVEVVKVLVGKIGNGKKANGALNKTSAEAMKAQASSELKAALLTINQQVQDRDGVPLSFHAREQIKISRAILKEMESLAQAQNETAHIQKSSVELLAKLETRMEALEKRAS